MPKSLYIDPNEVLRPGEHQIKFPEIPVMQYAKTVKEELKDGHFTPEDLKRIYRDMFVIREFETMLNLVKTTGGYNGVAYSNPGPAHLSAGQEAAAVGMAYNLDTDDFIFGSHRSHGEILAKGLNVMLGYYKNQEATEQTIDKDGWYHTGDLGTMDSNGNVYINGRIKNMLLGASGQNIYPEEIEDKLNSMTMVLESIVVQRDTKLVALVYPDLDEAKNLGLGDDDLKNIMEQNRNGLNQMLPAYEKISEIEIFHEEFEKTPKRSIKRYLYT